MHGGDVYHLLEKAAMMAGWKLHIQKLQGGGSTMEEGWEHQLGSVRAGMLDSMDLLWSDPAGLFCYVIIA